MPEKYLLTFKAGLIFFSRADYYTIQLLYNITLYNTMGINENWYRVWVSENNLFFNT